MVEQLQCAQLVLCTCSSECKDGFCPWLDGNMMKYRQAVFWFHRRSSYLLAIRIYTKQSTVRPLSSLRQNTYSTGDQGISLVARCNVATCFRGIAFDPFFKPKLHLQGRGALGRSRFAGNKVHFLLLTTAGYDHDISRGMVGQRPIMPVCAGLSLSQSPARLKRWHHTPKTLRVAIEVVVCVDVLLYREREQGARPS